MSEYIQSKIKVIKPGERIMLSANEAAHKSQEVIIQHTTEELRRIDAGINKEISKGRRSYSYDGYISPEGKSELEKWGYKVTTGSQYNQGYVIISW